MEKVGFAFERGSDSPILSLPLGGAAVYPCDKRFVFNAGFSR
jgi:hypothetical protein